MSRASSKRRSSKKNRWRKLLNSIDDPQAAYYFELASKMPGYTLDDAHRAKADWLARVAARKARRPAV